MSSSIGIIKVEVFKVSEQCVLTFEGMTVDDAVAKAIEMAEEGKLPFTQIDERFMAWGEPLITPPDKSLSLSPLQKEGDSSVG